MTNDWLGWLGRHDRSRPFFGFLYYDPPMGEVTADPAEALPMDERFTTNPQAKASWRNYRLAARFIDGEVGRVLDGLRDAQVLEDTVVVVLSDHGYEFDDNGLGYMGHASSYAPAQVRATLVIRWPGRGHAVYRHRSAHFATREVCSLDRDERKRLHRAVRGVLAEATKSGGSADTCDIYGRPGRYVRAVGARVKACTACRTPIAKRSFLGGATYYCPRCQG